MASSIRDAGGKTAIETRRVFLRAERGDSICVVDIVRNMGGGSIPEILTVIQRQMTYFGPKLRVESGNTQYLLTSPGPNKQAILWSLEGFDWTQVAEIRVDFTNDLPQYDICPYCGEKIATMAHERRSFLGTCDK